jgi:uncharacterized protein (TIGR02996 family)
MSDAQAAFLAAICAEPDDDAPRLIYADWLEEHGDLDRAEFIRAQCELARLEAEDCASQALFESLQERLDPALDRVNWQPIDAGIARRWELRRRVLALLKRHGKSWAAAAPRRCGLSWTWDRYRPWAAWDRGFLERATLKGATALRRSADALRHVPLRFLALPRPHADQARALLGSGLVGRVTGLWFDYGAADFLRALGAHADAARVTSLSSSQARNDIDDIARALTASANWRGLRRLNLRGSNDMSARATEGLLRAGHLRGLTLLRLNAGRWTTDTVRTLATAGLSELRTLELYGCPLNDEAAEALGSSPSLKRLRTLQLDTSGISGRGLSSLIASPRLPHLTVLTLHWCRNRSWKLNEQALANARGSSLRSLQISLMHVANLAAEAARALAGCPALRDLLVLNLQTNRLNDRALEALIHHARFTRLAVLDLSYNDFGDRGVAALARWPGLAGVRYLDLYENEIGDQGAQALAESPYLQGVQVLRLSRGRMSRAGVKALQGRYGDAVALL